MQYNRTTNELEFKGNIITWINAEIAKRPTIGLELATQEPSRITQKKNDLVVWRNRASNDAFFTLELKTPETPISDPELLKDACEKSQRWNARFFAIWNMQIAELYRTPPATLLASPQDRIRQYAPIIDVHSVDDWINPRIRELLRKQVLLLLDDASNEATRTGQHFPIDASVFVDRLTRRITELRSEVQPALTKEASQSKALRARLRQIAAAQGFLGFVDDVDAAVAGQFCYRIVGQILFYFALKRKQPSLSILAPDRSKPFLQAIRPFWDSVRDFDYEALFEIQEFDHIVPLPPHAEELIYDLIDGFNRYNWNSLTDDVFGAVFEQLIPRQQQVLLGQFYTPTLVADVLLSLAIDGDNPKVLDPGCGSGTFLLRGYQYLRDTLHLRHSQLLPLFWGFDISPFATELSVINLYRQDLTEFDNFPRVLSGDFFQRSVGQKVEFPPARSGIQKKVVLPIPQFDAVVANPPYLRSQNQDDLDPKYKRRLLALPAKEHGLVVRAKTDLFAFFIYHSFSFLRTGGRLAFITSSSWLTSDYGYQLQKFLLEKMRLTSVFASETESFFDQVDQNTVLFVAEKRDPDKPISDEEVIRFIVLKNDLERIIPLNNHWAKLQQFVSHIDSLNSNYEDEFIRVRCLPLGSELEALTQETKPRNWSLMLRAPDVYFNMIASKEKVVPLESLAESHLGYKSLQNQFFYVDEDTISAYGIEPEFLSPLYQLADLDDSSFIQDAKPRIQIFHCDRSESDLRGTGALKYIKSMEKRPAAKKRQSGKVETISEVLSKQSGRYWYSPKAIPQEAHLWLRKAFNRVYSPFVFSDARVVDQRCNYLIPKEGIKWQAVAAVLTSSIFALSIESSGSSSMGAGALEIPTTKLSNTIVPNLRILQPAQIEELIGLAEEVWERTMPLSWRDPASVTSQLRSLDEYLIDSLKLCIKPDDVYKGICHTLSVRIKLAEEKSKSKKAAETIDIKSIAEAIISNFKYRIDAIRFPESFIPTAASTTQMEIDPSLDLDVSIQPFFSDCEIEIKSEGDSVFRATLDRAVTDVIYRSLTLGRRKFPVPSSPSDAELVMNAFWDWFPSLLEDLRAECALSSLGSRFEGEIEKAVMYCLSWSQNVTQTDPCGHVFIRNTAEE